MPIQWAQKWGEAKQLELQENIEVLDGLNPGMDKAVLRHPSGYHAEVLLHGGQVISWSSPREEFLFCSRKSTFEPGVAVRGGIPISFPKFSLGTRANHGMVRDKIWEIDTESTLPCTANDTYIDLILKSTTDTAPSSSSKGSSSSSNWPHKFEFRLRVAVQNNGTLQLTSHIRNANTNGQSFKFRFAYHTYLAVSDIEDIRVEGLENIEYVDNLKGNKAKSIQRGAPKFESEFNRVYLDAPSKITVIDHSLSRRYEISKDHCLPDISVWNPWDKKSKSMPDLENNDYRKMVSVGPAIWQKYKLKPGHEWTSKMDITVVRSSYYGLHPPDLMLAIYRGPRVNENRYRHILHHKNGNAVEVLCYGGQVTSWTNKDGEDYLFASRNAIKNERAPFLGGISILFPNVIDSEEKGAFAREQLWSADLPTSPQFIDLCLNSKDCAQLNHLFTDHKFKLHLRIALEDNGSLVLTSRIKNLHTTLPLTFRFGYHTYLSVSDISQVICHGLKCHGLKKPAKDDDVDDELPEDPFTIFNQFSIFEACEKITIVDNVKRSYMIRTKNLPQAIVWYPLDKLSSPFAKGENQKMVCVNPCARIPQITLNADEEWTGIMELSVVTNCTQEELMMD